MNVLLSIRPRYVDAILSGRKKYEFRKSRPKFERNGQKAYIYTTAPVCKIVATFTIKAILESHPRELWRKFGKSSGLKADAFTEYFGVRKKGFAIEIASIKRFNPPIEPKDCLEDFVPPQSFRYVPSSWEDSLSSTSKTP